MISWPEIENHLCFDPAHVLDSTPLELREDLSFEEQPVGIKNGNFNPQMPQRDLTKIFQMNLLNFTPADINLPSWAVWTRKREKLLDA